MNLNLPTLGRFNPHPQLTGWCFLFFFDFLSLIRILIPSNWFDSNLILISRFYWLNPTPKKSYIVSLLAELHWPHLVNVPRRIVPRWIHYPHRLWLALILGSNQSNPCTVALKFAHGVGRLWNGRSPIPSNSQQNAVPIPKSPSAGGNRPCATEGSHPVATLCLALCLAPSATAMRLEPSASELLRSFAGMAEKVLGGSGGWNGRFFMGEWMGIRWENDGIWMEYDGMGVFHGFLGF